MAMTTGTMIALGLAAAGAGASAYNTNRTAKKQDASAAESIRNQGRLQRQADAKVNEQVGELEASTAADERAARLDDYMAQLRNNRGGLTSGLTPNIGSEAFQSDSARAAQDVEAGAGDLAGLMSRIDAPGMQRQGEAFGYGNLATDIGLVGRQSEGQRFIDDLRTRSIRRNPWIDAAAMTAQGAAGAMASGAGGGYQGTAGLQPYMAPAPTTKNGAAWFNAYGAGRR